jgi:hypothetical protein
MQEIISNQYSRDEHRITPNQRDPIIIDISGTNFIEILRAENISLGGIKILVAHEFRGCEINKQVKLAIKLPLPVNKSFSATGKIKHLTNSTFGIHFISFHKQGLQLLRKYISYHEREKSTWNTIRYFCHLY